jgi:hypothetical protein
MTLPANLPNVAQAALPQMYREARVALANCARIDECADWANKMEALASYAKMSEDDSLRKMADRIQGRAVRRCGELLSEYDGQGARTDLEPSKGALTKSQAADEAGMSVHQQRTAVRVANVAEADFERQIESDDPPTVTKLADQGKTARPLVDLEGRDPDDFAASTQTQAALARFVAMAKDTDPAAVARGAFPDEIAVMRENIIAARAWIDRLAATLGD